MARQAEGKLLCLLNLEFFLTKIIKILANEQLANLEAQKKGD